MDYASTREEALARIAAAQDLDALEGLRIEFLGKQGSISGLLKTLGAMSPDERQQAGPQIHALREAVTDALARRMGIATGDPAVRIVLDTWAVLVAAGVDTPGATIASPDDIMDRIGSSYSVFTRLWQPWRDPGQPPSGEAGR